MKNKRLVITFLDHPVLGAGQNNSIIYRQFTVGSKTPHTVGLSTHSVTLHTLTRGWVSLVSFPDPLLCAHAREIISGWRKSEGKGVGNRVG